SRDLGAVNKLFNANITKKEAHLARRSYKKITRSRSEKAYNKNYNPKNYEKQIVVAKAFGLRRESFVTGDYRLKEGSIYQHNNTVYAAVVEKGGKFRNVEARFDMQEQIKRHFQLREQPRLYSEQAYKKLIELINSAKTYSCPTRLKLITMPYGVSTRKRNIRNWKTSCETPNKIITSNMISGP